MPGEEDLSFSDWQAFIEDLSTPLPYSDPTIRIFIDAVAFAIAGVDFLPPEHRKTGELLRGVRMSGMARIDQAAGAPRTEEALHLLRLVAWKTVAYQHQRLMEMGQPLSQCPLNPPCQFH